MNLKKNGLLAKLFFITYWMEPGFGKDERQQYLECGTNLCHVFRRVFFVLPFQIAIVCLLSIVFIGLGVGMWKNPLVSIISVGVIVGIIFICFGVVKYSDTELCESTREWVRAKKERYCPQVTFVERKNDNIQRKTE